MRSAGADLGDDTGLQRDEHVAGVDVDQHVVQGGAGLGRDALQRANVCAVRDQL